MLNEKQFKNFNLDCAEWLEKFLKSQRCAKIKAVYTAGKLEGYTRTQIKAARAWEGKYIITREDSWVWNR